MRINNPGLKAQEIINRGQSDKVRALILEADCWGWNQGSVTK